MHTFLLGTRQQAYHAQQARCCRPDVLRTSPALRASEVTCLPIPAMRQHDKACLAAAFTPVAQVPPLKQTRIRVKIPRGGKQDWLDSREKVEKVLWLWHFEFTQLKLTALDLRAMKGSATLPKRGSRIRNI